MKNKGPELLGETLQMRYIPVNALVTILVILLRRRPIMLITCMITDRIGFHSVLLPLSTKIFMLGAKPTVNMFKEVT